MGLFDRVFGKKVAEQVTPASRDPYNALLNDCLSELKAKNQLLANHYGVGTHERWNVDQETGVLTFSHAGTPQVACDVAFLGSFSSQTNTWLWGWANKSILERLTREVLRVKEYGEREVLNDFVELKIECSEDEAWAFAAVALRVLDGLGVYRGPTGNGCVMMMIKTIRKVDGEHTSVGDVATRAAPEK